MRAYVVSIAVIAACHHEPTVDWRPWCNVGRGAITSAQREFQLLGKPGDPSWCSMFALQAHTIQGIGIELANSSFAMPDGSESVKLASINLRQVFFRVMDRLSEPVALGCTETNAADVNGKLTADLAAASELVEHACQKLEPQSR